MLKMVITVPTALGVGRAGVFYDMQRAESWGLNSKGQKTAEESLKSETKHGSVSGQKTEKRGKENEKI